MGESGSKKKEGLLQVAADVIAGTRGQEDLSAHGLSLGEPIVGDEAKKLLLDELDREQRQERELSEHVVAADALWQTLVTQGIKAATLGRFEATFEATEITAAGSLVAEFNGAEWGQEGWTARVKTEREGGVRVTVLTRPIVLGPESLHELANLLAIAGHEHGCKFAGMKLAAPRPWWKFW
jgi:hypothetical protein